MCVCVCVRVYVRRNDRIFMMIRELYCFRCYTCGKTQAEGAHFSNSQLAKASDEEASQPARCRDCIATLPTAREFKRYAPIHALTLGEQLTEAVCAPIILPKNAH